MAKQRHLLTNIQLTQWMKHGTPLAKSDGDGLTFTLSKAGTASWTLRYYSQGKRRELTLGNYPDITLSDARKLASSHRAAIDGGANPAAEKALKKTASTEWTIKQLVDDYRAKRLVVASFAPATIYYRNADLNNVIVPRIGSRTVASITGQDVVQMLLDANNTWTISKRTLTTTTKLFEHAAGLRLVSINPCAGVSLNSLFGNRPPIKKRIMLSAEDLRILLATMDTLGTANSLALRILLATCVRTSELVRARWEDIDFEKGNWFVPDASTKTRRGFLVPLTPPVIGWLKHLQSLAAGSPFVLPARISRKLGQTITTRTLWNAIDQAFKTERLTVTKFTPHDMRSTAKGHLKNLGIAEHITEMALSHTIKGMSGIYDVREEIPEKRAALEAWATFLLDLTRE